MKQNYWIGSECKKDEATVKNETSYSHQCSCSDPSNSPPVMPNKIDTEFHCKIYNCGFESYFPYPIRVLSRTPQDAVAEILDMVTENVMKLNMRSNDILTLTIIVFDEYKKSHFFNIDFSTYIKYEITNLSDEELDDSAY